ncbi:hypothetical protein Ga0102493_112515 [Erythrobacter litoralis]|nr:hypothetical protein Ga0102493_112515 [Erythrobacter litoralis]
MRDRPGPMILRTRPFSFRPLAALAFVSLALASCDNPRGDRADETRIEPETIEASPEALEDPGAVPPRAVLIGFDGPRFDACAGYGLVRDLPDGNPTLPVRAAPSRESVEVDRIGQGQGVSMCQQVGDWIGIVYAPEGTEISCGTNSPVSSVRAYEGPCNQGWVDENFVKLVAG